MSESPNPYVGLPRGPYLFTATGGKFHVFDPTVDEIDIFHIAQALSRQDRYAGAGMVPCTVARHSINVALVLRRQGSRHAREGLMHDAPEAHLQDVVRPLKMQPGIQAVYGPAEDCVAGVIAKRYGLTHPLPYDVHVADNAVCDAEIQQNIFMDDEKADWDRSRALHMNPADIVITETTWREDRDDFLALFFELFPNEIDTRITQ